MKGFALKKSVLAGTYVIAAVIAEIITFSLMRLGMLPKYFLLDLVIIFAVGAVTFIIPYSAASIVVTSLLLLAQIGVSIVNVTLFSFYGDIFSRDLLALTGEAKGMMNKGVINYNLIYGYGALFLAALGISIFIAVKIRGRFSFKRKNLLFLAAVLYASAFCLPFSYQMQLSSLRVDTASDRIMKADDKSLYSNMSSKSDFFVKFGTFPFYFKNFILMQNIGVYPFASIDELKRYLFYNYAEGEESGYFGADKGNNLIVVCMESMDEFFINEKYTPMLYNLRRNGINFENYYSRGRTDTSEASVIFGSYPNNQYLVEIRSWDETDWSLNAQNANVKTNYFFSLPNVLKQDGIAQSSYFHPNSGYYYSRIFTHRQYGFDDLYFTEDLAERSAEDLSHYINSWLTPERRFLEEFADEFLPDERFFSFLMTINAHGPYYDLDSAYHQDFYDVIDDADFPDINSEEYYPFFKTGLTKAMAVDDGIACLFEQLEERDLLDNTTVLFYADHNAYFHDLTYQIKNSGVLESAAFKVPCFIYSPGVGALTVDKFTMVFDLVPTLFQLLGIKYNTGLYLGESAFSGIESVISDSGAVMNDKFFTLSGVEPRWTAPGATAEDFRKFQENYVRMRNKWYYIDALYEYNLDL